jgi:hypothetical protein
MVAVTGVCVMPGSKPKYDVFVSRPTANDKNFYTKVGAGWAVAKEGISIQLDALPTDGKLVLFPIRVKDK